MVVNILLDAVIILLFLISAYYLSTALFSLFGKYEKESENEYEYTYTVVIPAHNEEKTIADTVLSVYKTRYEKSKLRVLVVADGCTDNTKATALNCGAEVIEKTFSTTKGDALYEAFKYLKSCDIKSDYIAVFDADNIIDEYFFINMNNKLSNGFKCVQGYIDSKNPNESWVSNAYSVWYYIFNRVMQVGRDNLGLNVRLMGTGMVFSFEILDMLLFKTDTYAEDMEYSCALWENGIKIGFSKDAIVYDEKPTSLKESLKQRERWTKGICDVQGLHTFKLLKLKKINDIFALWGEVLSQISFFILSMSYALNVGNIWNAYFSKSVFLIYFFGYIMIDILGLIKDRKLSKKTVTNAFGLIIVMLTWIPIGIFGLFGKRKGWYHTKHKKMESGKLKMNNFKNP